MTKIRSAYVFCSLLAAAAFLCCGCSRDGAAAETPLFGGPADVTLVLQPSSATRSGIVVDEDRQVRTVRIFAFKHGTGESVGYGYFNERMLSGSGTGPYYLRMSLSASGPIDFHVLLNDGYADGAPEIAAAMSPEEIAALRFTGLRAVDEAYAVPMSNLPGDADASGYRSNFTYQVEENPSAPQIIEVAVRRCMARLTLNFAKKGAGKVYITRFELLGGAADAPLAGTGDALPVAFAADRRIGLLDGSVDEGTALEITVPYVAASPHDSAYHLGDYDTYMLPAPVGSTDADSWVADNPQGVANPDAAAYRLLVRYLLDGYDEPREKTVYLPKVGANEQINVWGVLDSEASADFRIEVIPWSEVEIDIPPFE